MLDFDFSPAEVALRERVREFARSELAPHVRRWARGQEFPWDAVRALGRAGFLGITFDESVGGANGSWVDLAIVLEEIGRVDLSCALIASLANFYPRVIDDQSVVSRIVAGDAALAFAETEARSGGDVAAIRTSAVRTESGWLLNGSKTYISMVPGADLLLVTAVTDPDAGGRGLSMFLVDADQKGVTARSIPEPGLRAHMLGSITLKDVEIPHNRIVASHLAQASGILDLKQCADSVAILGATQQTVEETVQRAKAKKTFGRSLLKWQGIQSEIVGHLARLEALKLMMFERMWCEDTGKEPVVGNAPLSTLVAHEADIIHRSCLDLFGGAAWRSDNRIHARSEDILVWTLNNRIQISSGD